MIVATRRCVSSNLMRFILIIDYIYKQFLYDTARTTVVTFDDTGSIGDKASYAKNVGLAGAFAWSLNQVSPRALCIHRRCE